MKSLARLTVLFLAAIVASAACVLSAPAEKSGEIIIESADYFRHEKNTNTTIVSGNVVIRFIDASNGDNIVIRAEEAAVDDEKKVASARGKVVLSHPQAEVEGESLLYDFREKYFEMTNVSGSTEGSSDVNGQMYFKGERMQGTSRKIKIYHSRFNTCGPACGEEYNMVSKDISIFPNKKIIARKVGVYIRHTRVMYLPVYIVSLKDEDNYRPEFGYNKTEGYFMKNRYPYLGKEAVSGWLILNTMSKIGREYGAEHKYTSQRLGGAGNSLIRTNEQKNSGTNNTRIHQDQAFKIGDSISGNLNYDRINTYNIYRESSRTNTTNLSTTINYRQNSYKSINTSYRFSANKGTSESENGTITINRKTRLGKKITFDYMLEKTFRQSGTNPKDEEGRMTSTARYRGPWYNLTVSTYKDFDLDGDEYTGDSSKSVDTTKLPEVIMQLDSSLWREKLPDLTSVKFTHGRYRQGRRNDSEALRRSEVEMVARKTYNFGSRFQVTPSQTYTQRFYSTKDAMYVMQHTTQAVYTFDKEKRFQANYRRSGDSGGTPYPRDKRSEQISLDGNFTLNKSSTDPITKRTRKTTSYSMSTSYNYRTLQYAPLSFSYVRALTQNSLLDVRTSRNLNNHEWNDTSTRLELTRDNTKLTFNARWDTKEADLQTVDFTSEHKRRNGWNIKVRGYYEHKSKHSLVRNIIATKTRCCTQMQYFYDTERDEFKFQYSILAFPSQKFGFTQSSETGFEMDDSFMDFSVESAGTE